MADSVRESILKNLVTTLKGISPGAEYEFQFARVERLAQSAFQPTAYPTVIIVEAGEDCFEGEPTTYVTCNLRIELFCYNYQFTDQSTAANKILAGVIVALAVDPTRGGFALNTTVTANETILADELVPYGGISIFVEILYRYKLGDPFSK